MAPASLASSSPPPPPPPPHTHFFALDYEADKLDAKKLQVGDLEDHRNICLIYLLSVLKIKTVLCKSLVGHSI